MPPEAVLSSREIQILKLVADGMTNREIAETLFLSRYTVECHVKKLQAPPFLTHQGHQLKQELAVLS